jgi:uncharacterized membrane protein
MKKGGSMKNIPNKQRGGSPVLTIMVLVVLAYGVFIGIQYVPQWTEARSVQSILDSAQSSQATEPLRSEQAVSGKITRMLQVNELNDLTDAFQVTRTGEGFLVEFDYERELNLGWERKAIQHRYSALLRG